MFKIHFKQVIFVLMVALAAVSLGQIINPWTGREEGVDQLLENRSRMNPYIRNRRIRNRVQPQDRSDNLRESEYLLSDGTPIYKFFKKNPYGKK